MTYTIPALTLTDAQVETIERLSGGSIEYAYVKLHSAYTGDVIVSHSSDYIQYEWVVAPDGSHTQLYRYLDSDGWNDGEVDL